LPRAALSLAKLYRAANRDAGAHAALAPAVEDFPPTEVAEIAGDDSAQTADNLHKIVQNRLALLGKESVSVGNRRHPLPTRMSHFSLVGRESGLRSC
jgi:hypothetical protein